jgi:hypothetical protein
MHDIDSRMGFIWTYHDGRAFFYYLIGRGEVEVAVWECIWLLVC